MIEQKDFDKLKQLDRIEYRQYRNFINESYEVGCFNFTWYLLIISAIFISSITIIKDITGEINYDLLHVSTLILGFVFILIIFNALLVLLFGILKKKKMNELDNKYFKVEVKK